jgi:hypothetical protein
MLRPELYASFILRLNQGEYTVHQTAAHTSALICEACV